MYREIVGNAITCWENNALGPTHVVLSSAGTCSVVCATEGTWRNWWHVGTCSGSFSCHTGASEWNTLDYAFTGYGHPQALGRPWKWLCNGWMTLLLALFPVLKSVICLDPSEHLSAAAFWSCIPVPGEILRLAEKRALGKSLLKVEFRAASGWEGCCCLRVILVHIWFGIFLVTNPWCKKCVSLITRLLIAFPLWFQSFLYVIPLSDVSVPSLMLLPWLLPALDVKSDMAFGKQSSYCTWHRAKSWHRANLQHRSREASHSSKNAFHSDTFKTSLLAYLPEAH